MISTRNLKPLGEISQIKRLTQAIAVLEAIICPEWEYRYYSFNSQWSDGEMLASMRNGSGDEWYLLFNSHGAIMKGLDHESAMFEFGTPKKEIYDEVPLEFKTFLDEPAFDIKNVSFCIWRTLKDSCWNVGNINYPDGNDPDGSEYLLGILDRKPETYKDFADHYYESSFDIETIKSIYEHQPLTDRLIENLNDTMNLKALEKELLEIVEESKNRAGRMKTRPTIIRDGETLEITRSVLFPSDETRHKDISILVFNRS